MIDDYYCSLNPLDNEIKRLDSLLEKARKEQIILNKTNELKRIAMSMGLPYDYFFSEEMDKK
nr:MAG TPA: hypothetical protein [Caudoviricetes sp.]